MMKTTEAIVATDRWNSFDRFHDTTQTLVDCYQRAGAGAAVDRIQTGGRIGSGRWIIQEAQDIRSATVDIVHPFRERVADYRNNPWHAVQWTAATPKGGLRGELVVIDRMEDLGYEALWEERHPAVTGWFRRMKDRPAVQTAFYKGSRFSDVYPELKLGRSTPLPA